MPPSFFRNNDKWYKLNDDKSGASCQIIRRTACVSRMNSMAFNAFGGSFVGFAVNLLLWRFAHPNFLAVVEYNWFFYRLYAGLFDQPGFCKAGSCQSLKGMFFQRMPSRSDAGHNSWGRYYIVLGLYASGILMLLVGLTYGWAIDVMA